MPNTFHTLTDEDAVIFESIARRSPTDQLHEINTYLAADQADYALMLNLSFWRNLKTRSFVTDNDWFLDDQEFDDIPF